jgi:hypothetical protein
LNGVDARAFDPRRREYCFLGEKTNEWGSGIVILLSANFLTNRGDA